MAKKRKKKGGAKKAKKQQARKAVAKVEEAQPQKKAAKPSAETAETEAKAAPAEEKAQPKADKTSQAAEEKAEQPVVEEKKPKAKRQPKAKQAASSGEDLEPPDAFLHDLPTELETAGAAFKVGDNQAAARSAVAVLEGSPPAGTISRARELLSRIEMDLRTLSVGAASMFTLVLILAFGIKAALWSLPVVLIILFLPPRLFQTPKEEDQ